MNALLTIHKYFLRLHLDYGDIAYDQSIVYNHPTNDSLGKKLESALYNAALVATGVIKETLLETLYKELARSRITKIKEKVKTFMYIL